MGQRFIARERRTFTNGAVGWAPGGPFDCLGPYAKIENCPVVVLQWFPYPGRENEPEGSPGCGITKHVDTGQRRTCYAMGYADTFFSVPACTTLRGKHVRGFFTNDGGTYYNAKTGADVFVSSSEGGCVFIVCADWAKRFLLSPVKREPIRERYLYGERFTRGDRKAEAVRAYAGEWSVFRYVGGTMLRADTGERRTLGVERMSYPAACAMARAFVESENI